jgi:hypothetical protein
MSERERAGSMTVSEWCSHRRLSRAQAYKLWKQGRGPRFYQIGARRYISAEADAQWLAAREAESAA